MSAKGGAKGGWWSSRRTAHLRKYWLLSARTRFRARVASRRLMRMNEERNAWSSACVMRDHDVVQVVLIKDACPGRGAAARHENFCAKYTELLQRGSLAEHSASPRSWYAC